MSNQYNFTWPVEKWKRISSYFGYRDITGLPEGSTAFHDAIDISAAAGTNVLAALPGEVTFAGTNKYRGNYIIIQHSDGVTTEYAHMQELIAKAGDIVKAGDVIGLVGSTGASTGPHLDFKIKENGSAIDPLTFKGLSSSTETAVDNMTEAAQGALDKVVPVVKQNWLFVAIGMILFAIFTK